MAKKQENTFEQKYEIGTKIITLEGKNIKEGYAFANSKGIIKSFNNKDNTYKVVIKTVDGADIEVEYKEEELVLENIPSTSNEVFKTNSEKIVKLNKQNKLMTFIGCGIVLALLIAAIIIMFTVKDSRAMLAIFIVIMVVVLAIGVSLLLLTSKNTKLIYKLSKQMETAAISEKEKK